MLKLKNLVKGPVLLTTFSMMSDDTLDFTSVFTGLGKTATSYLPILHNPLEIKTVTALLTEPKS